MEKVGFTKSSARRIADAVRRVERTPEELPAIQRRRSGGRSLDMLWEVTAVQSVAETCTIKRVTEFDTLNDQSEQLEVLYDPDSVPAVGDFGLLLSLGDGSRFFFPGGGGSVVRLQIGSKVSGSTYNATIIETSLAIEADVIQLDVAETVPSGTKVAGWFEGGVWYFDIPRYL